LSKINNYFVDQNYIESYTIARMANLKSAIKRIRKIQRQNVVNRLRKKRFKNALKKINSLIESKKKKEALAFLPKFNSEVMKIAKTGLIKKKNASRNVSRITRRVNSLITT
tara:strand:+ start:843 stop:1175 length:333 start_codon:yes stop_codon:yes gene_type:complete